MNSIGKIDHDFFFLNLLVIFTLRCRSDDSCVACTTIDEKHYVISKRRGTEQEKQTLVSLEGGAIYTCE